MKKKQKSSNTLGEVVRLHVRRFDTREIVHSVDVTWKSPRDVERVMMGMLRNMNTDDYFIDDDEVTQANAEHEPPRERTT